MCGHFLGLACFVWGHNEIFTFVFVSLLQLDFNRDQHHVTVELSVKDLEVSLLTL